MTLKEATDYIKKVIFTRLFGGGKMTVTNEILKPSKRDETIEKLREWLIIAEKALRLDFHLDSTKTIFTRKMINNKSKLNYAEILDATDMFETLVGEIFNYDSIKSFPDYTLLKTFWDESLDEGYKIADKLELDLEKIEHAKSVFDIVESVIKAEYPGILEAFEYYQKYYIENKETFPTFLNWSTVIDFPETIRDISSKSKSYPIQASSAEYMRQWLLELSNNRNYKRNFQIVNTIHDQVLIETSKEFEDAIKDILINTSKEAAMNVGINSDTLHIEFDKYPKLKSDPKEITKDDICL